MDTIGLADLEAAQEVVYANMAPTPQLCWPLLSARCGSEVWVKHENHTPIGAFKVRGGLVLLGALLDANPEITGVITATRGNHGQSIAYAARRYGIDAVIVVPRGNNPEKNAAMKALGGELIEHGRDFQEASEHIDVLAAGRGLYVLPSFDPMLAVGVGTYALEFLRSVPNLDTVYVPIGLGSGISGMIAARDALNLETRIVGVVSENAAAYALSFEAGRPVSTESADTIADGVACRVPDETALAIILQGAERVVTVSEDAILTAMGHYFTDTHNLAEGAGAAPLAALLQDNPAKAGKRVGLVLSGGNVDRELFKRVLEQGEAPNR